MSDEPKEGHEAMVPPPTLRLGEMHWNIPRAATLIDSQTAMKKESFPRPVIRQDSMRTENSAIPCRDGYPIQVLPSPSIAKNLPEERPRGIRVYIRNPALCQLTTVSGVTAMRDCCHPDQNRRTATQQSLSSRSSLGRGCRRFRTASC